MYPETGATVLHDLQTLGEIGVLGATFGRYKVVDGLLFAKMRCQWSVTSLPFVLFTLSRFCFPRLMAKAPLRAMVQHCDRLLGTATAQDYAGAVNGLQVENRGTVSRIAQRIYEDRAFDRMPVLADALEDAGCADADVLAHCRRPAGHVRGCWVIDLLLGKG